MEAEGWPSRCLTFNSNKKNVTVHTMESSAKVNRLRLMLKSPGCIQLPRKLLENGWYDTAELESKVLLFPGLQTWSKGFGFDGPIV